MRRGFFVGQNLGWLCVLGSVMVSASAWGTGKKSSPPPSYSTWMAYWDGNHARAALSAAAPHLEEVDVFAYHFAQDDRLVPAHPTVKEFQDLAQHLPGPAKPRIAITIVNDFANPNGIHLKDPACVHRVLISSAARAAHIQEILAIAQDADAIDIDYERVAAEDESAFIQFIQVLAGALHEKSKRLSVVVEPRISDKRTADPLSSATNTLTWKDLAQAADRVTVMAYLYHYGGSEPGSIAPMDWVNDIGAYGLQNVPADKLCIALHLGGFDWPKNGPGKSIDYDRADALAEAYGKSIKMDQKTQSGTFVYSDGSASHQVWIETASGIKAKVRKLRGLGITHIALWRLGAGDPALWVNLTKN